MRGQKKTLLVAADACSVGPDDDKGCMMPQWLMDELQVEEGDEIEVESLMPALNGAGRVMARGRDRYSSKWFCGRVRGGASTGGVNDPTIMGSMAARRAKCSQGHTLKLINRFHSWQCDVCSSSCNYNPRLRCQQCDFDMCSKCAEGEAAGLKATCQGGNGNGNMQCDDCRSIKPDDTGGLPVAARVAWRLPHNEMVGEFEFHLGLVEAARLHRAADDTGHANYNLMH